MKSCIHLLACIFFGLLFILFSSKNLSAQTVQFGKSYVNISKPNGGTFEPGDILEIRATIALSSGSITKLRYNDTIPANCTYITGSLRTITNEGFTYFSYTDANDVDSGHVNGNYIRVNMGNTAGAANESTQGNSVTNGGSLANNMRPSFNKNTCIRVIAYRVQINSGLSYGSTITIPAGNFRYLNSTGVASISNLAGYEVLLSQNLSLCSNSVGANALISEFNGTFGSGKAKNRGTSSLVPLPYTYKIFSNSNPNDNYYGISNNTSGVYTTNSNLSYPNASRVFNVWDIIGDHTNATDPFIGNPPADTVNSTGGYALIINASYQPNAAFTQTITNLCPNTYYEFSAWFRNICRKCRCDSTGVSATQAGFTPGAGNDSAGVRPNLTFQINGVDCYTTGNLPYTGYWEQRGYTLITGPSQNSFTISIRNNAPGGGGNDWAIDDIKVATCNPVQILNPPVSYIGCNNAAYVTFIDTVKTYFTNYKFVQWEKSCDNGNNWDIIKNDTLTFTSQIGTDSVGRSLYGFIPVYADSNCLIRVKAATTHNNLSDVNCSVVSSGATRLIISNCVSLNITFNAFTGLVKNNNAQLSWNTSVNLDNGYFLVEKSLDGRNFNLIGTVPANAYNTDMKYSYFFEDQQTLMDGTYYRIKATNANGSLCKYSNVIFLRSNPEMLSLISYTNPVKNELTLQLNAGKSGRALFELIDLYGNVLFKQSKSMVRGNNRVQLFLTNTIASGNYVLRIQLDASIINKQVLKL